MHLPEQVRSKIEKLLALTESSNVHEAALAMEKAQELLNRYNLSRADVQPSEQKPDIVHEWYPLFEHAHGPKEWRYDLVRAIAKHNLCDVLYSTHKVILIGRAQDHETVMWLYNHLAPRLYTMADTAVRGYRDERRSLGLRGAPRGGQSYASYRNNYLRGAVAGIAARLHSLKEAMAESSLAIILYNAEALIEYRDEQFPRLGTISHRSHGNSGAYAKGRIDGRAMTWGRPLEGSSAGRKLTG